MKFLFYAIFSLVCGWVFYGCFSPKTHYPTQIDNLRKLYASGDQRKWPKPYLHSSVMADFEDIGVLPKVEFPKENPYSKDKAELARHF